MLDAKSHRATEAESLWCAAEYSRCLEALSLQPPGAPRYLLAAKCYDRLRRYDRALAVLREGAAYFSGHSELEAAALAAKFTASLGDAEANRYFLGMLEAAPAATLPSRLRATIVLAQASCAWMRGDLIEAEALVASVQVAADYHVAAEAKFVRSWIRWSRGKTVEQASLLSEALELLGRAETRDVGLIARCAYALAAIAREYHLPRCNALLADTLKTLAWTQDLAVEHFQALRLLAWSQALQAGYIPAIRHLHAARAVAPSPYFEVLSRFDRAWVSRIAGERASYEAEALGAAEQALSLDWTAPSGEESTTLLVGAEMVASIDASIAEALLARYEDASRHVARTMAIRHDPKVAALAHVAAAAVAAAKSDVNALRHHAKAAFDTYDGLGVAWRAAWCALLLYRAGCGDEWLAVARTNIADYPRSFIATELRRFDGQRSRVRTSDLTARQREIFDLLMDGLSIDDVATRLICSRNTVRIHVGAIYRKFGVRNRVELLTQVPAG
ncbi:MAG: helix-turn-helix transcriptional regulator [Candidatus Eremiobacteraeota bacterium]|nr:helix-turn-helix transcriptional regulator [Candidatus Eremiobacteraeota bacterium]